ncbi:thiamine phosphate synthase [Marivirga sp. S37H4]|uniref:Thiamine phosphate synthase n=1 Tax=Marivirga aurantiaca TaxID=2802615 RepID=A0A934WVX4_9BACT|nr:thiamine phosphate synthase [Marivirga aurantiaca]MBK6263916.1 thiamine phosphate synthase [Marivirga aurantiaca]
MAAKRNISSGVYLVIDPSMEEGLLLKKLKAVLPEEIAAVQIWDNFHKGQNIQDLIEKICAICYLHNIPVLINNQWELLLNTSLDGVHFDVIPENYNEIKQTIKREFISGVTINNDLTVVKLAEMYQMDYLSFCSVFPSVTSNSCELVSFDTIKATRKLTSMPVFLAGGIRPDNIHQLKDLPFEGVAVVSGIMSSTDPAGAVKNYITQLKANKK